MTELPLDLLELLRENPDAMNVPGGLLTKQGPQDYVGSVPAIAGTLFFKDAHLPAVRDAISACFEEFQVKAEPKFTWLYREDPPEGPDKRAYAEAKPLNKMLVRMDPDDAVSFHYTSGVKAQDAGPWEFQVVGLQAWRAAMGGWGLCGLRFSLPILFSEENPGLFQELFVSFARRLCAVHGYGGYSLILSAARYDENQAFETFLTSKFKGFDAGHLVAGAATADLGIKTVGWLTAIDNDYVEKIGGISTIRSELPMDWFGLFDYGTGLVIQGGPQPDAAPADLPVPARLVLPNMLLKPIRTTEIGMHYASAGSEPRLIGHAAEEWLNRFDVADNELMAYKAKLLDEPKFAGIPNLPTRR